MGALLSQLYDELGYDPDDVGVPEVAAVPEVGDVIVVHGGMIAAREGARRVAVARLASGRLVVVDDRCPHDGGPISDGFVDGERLVCARHGWELEVHDQRCERACKLRE